MPRSQRPGTFSSTSQVQSTSATTKIPNVYWTGQGDEQPTMEEGHLRITIFNTKMYQKCRYSIYCVLYSYNLFFYNLSPLNVTMTFKYFLTLSILTLIKAFAARDINSMIKSAKLVP
uniref:Uncharacterized protein n=1 Tax=Romanomermis culicivorax TaxID=13658 RepID=A0A915HS35_ROMCU